MARICPFSQQAPGTPGFPCPPLPRPPQAGGFSDLSTLRQETSWLFLMLQDFLEVWAAPPVWHKLVCFTLFFNVGIFHKTSFRQLQPCLSVFSRGFCMLAITNSHPNSKVFATTSSARGSSNLSLFAQLENCLVLLSLEIKYCNYNRYYFNYFNR